MASKTQERPCTRIGRMLALMSLTFADRDPSQTAEEQAEPQLHPAAEELPEEQPLEEVQATGSGERQVVPGEGESEVAGAEEGQVVPEDKEPEKQRQVSKGDRSSDVSKEVLTTTEEIQEDISSLPSRSLEKVEKKRRKRKLVLPEAEAGTSSQFAKPQVEEAWPSHQHLGGGDSGEKEQANMKYMAHCPLFRIPAAKCMWTGKRGFLEDHVTKIHNDICRTGSWIWCISLTNTVLIMRCYNEMFLYYKYFSESFMYVFIQQIGITTLSFSYTIQLYSKDGKSDNIKYHFRISSLSYPFEDILRELRCLVIERLRLESFTANDQLAMSVSIRPFFPFKEALIKERENMTRIFQGQTVKIGDETVKCPLLVDKAVKWPLLGDEIVKCPMFKLPLPKCHWSGKAKILGQHLLTEHGHILIRDPEFNCGHLAHRALPILFNDEVFLYYKYISYTCMYAVVQQVGLTNEKYTYTVELRAKEDKGDDITSTSIANSIRLPLELVFEVWDCMVIPLDRLDPFIANREINMKVRITCVHTQQETLVTGAE